MTVSVLQETSATGTGTTFAATFANNTVAGSSFHVLCRETSATTFSCADGTNTYTQRGSTLIDGGSHATAQFTCDNVAGGNKPTITITSSGGTSALIIIREIGGTSGYDVQASQQQNASTGTDTVSSGTATPTVQPGLISAWSQSYTAGGALSSGTGFTSDVATSGFAGGLTEHLRYTSTAAVAATWNLSTNSSTTHSFAAFFKEGATASGGPKPLGGPPRVQWHWR